MKSVLPFLLAACLALPAAAETPRLKLDAATQTRLQIRTAPIEAAHSTDAVSGFAGVMDTSPLLQLLSDHDAAVAAFTASSAEATRTAGLAKDATVSSKVAEAARAQAAADQAKVTLLRQRLGLEWGPYFAALPDAALTRLAHDIALGQAALVRIDTPSGKGLKSAATGAIDLGALGTVQARVVGIARTADARLQSPGVVAIVTGSQAAYLGTGLTLNARLYGSGGTDGLLIPNSALLRQSGHVYAYVKSGAGTFDRREVVPARVVPEGLITSQGFRAGEVVVTQGAAALLTAETPKQAAD